MNIQWFPGHMTKALRMMQECVPLVDSVIYVLDARAAFACINPVLDEIVQNKPVFYALNKADLINKAEAEKIKRAFESDGKAIEALNGTAAGDAKRLAEKVKALSLLKTQKYAAKGVRAAIRTMVLGVPNSGKSSIINSLKSAAGGRGVALTGNKPGVTRGRQWVRIDDYFEVLDTPGTLYPKLTDNRKALHLAYIGSINDDVLDIQELALSLAAELDGLDSRYISQRYSVADGSPAERMEGIAKGRGFIKKGGVPDVEKAAVALIDDFRKGRLGKIALESGPL